MKPLASKYMKEVDRYLFYKDCKVNDHLRIQILDAMDLFAKEYTMEFIAHLSERYKTVKKETFEHELKYYFK